MSRFLMLMVFVLGLPGAASALTISADLDTADCFSTGEDCVGGLYTLDVAPAAGVDRYTATLTADFTGDYDLDVGSGDRYIAFVEIKVANAYIDPISSGGDDVFAGPLNGGGCGGDNDTKICVQLDPRELVTSSVMSWTIDFGAEELLSEDAWHIGAMFQWTNPGNGKINSALLSASAPPIPEPASAALLAIGGLLVGAAVRRPA